MSSHILKEEILDMVKLYENGMSFVEISAAMHRDCKCVTKHIHNYYRYGDSYFTQYPTPVR